MNIAKVEENLQKLFKNFSSETFIYDLLNAYGKPRASIARLQKGTLNLSKKADEIIWKKNLYFKKVKKDDLYLTLNYVSQNEQIKKHGPRFLIISDYQTLLAIDTKTTEMLDIPIKELPESFNFFLPLSGLEKTSIHKENEADVKAADRMAKIYEEICKLNPNMGPKQKDATALNVFLSRLLFCFFAESTEIFNKNQFIEAVNDRTMENGCDLQVFLEDLFELLNKKKNERSDYPKWLSDFPYVNGGLFKDRFKIPTFSQRLRKMIIDSGRLDWSSINPDIFGSMIQSVVDPDKRSTLGMHYTSVANIMKVIQPLFLDDFYQELEKSKNNKRRLEELYDRLGKIKIFDPACGSGNFLIIAYKELRQFEIQLLKYLELLGKHPTFLSQVQLSQFYGIEIDEFACEIAKLSLWLAEHQMNMVFKKTFGESAPSLPLKEGGHIVCGNATRLDWEKVCPRDNSFYVYVLGNPPYLGFLQQKPSHKEDMDIVFSGKKTIKKLDYIACWFYKGSEYIKGYNSKLAFVSTNSLTQGEQVALLWPHIFEKNVEIEFAHLSFKWTNNAKHNAGVSCVIIGIRNKCTKIKFLFKGNVKYEAKNINGYLATSQNIEVKKCSWPISKLPKISLGSSAYDGGNLMLTKQEWQDLISKYPESKKMTKKFVGSAEFLQGIERYCLWIDDTDLKNAWKIPPIKERLNKVISFREASDRKLTFDTAKTPHRFTEDRYVKKSSIIIPIVSSEKREYYVCGFLNGSEAIPNSARAIYNSESYVFGILSCKMHMLWVKATAGQLETRIRYSAICYNNFPISELNKKQKEQIQYHVQNILEEREKHPEKTIAELYNPQKMPIGLREAHRNLDAAVERCYRSKPFESDEERLEHLFKLYEEMIQNKKTRN